MTGKKLNVDSFWVGVGLKIVDLEERLNWNSAMSTESRINRTLKKEALNAGICDSIGPALPVVWVQLTLYFSTQVFYSKEKMISMPH
ncbi:hypothetical protein B0E43_14395 [Algoriphagus sp. A40]|nr:hypothetical protein B0E43_14395 [Algoriphagus sp. A40]